MKIPLKLPRIRLPNLKFRIEIVQELAMLAGFLMAMKGFWDIDYRLALILGGLWLMLPPKGGK